MSEGSGNIPKIPPGQGGIGDVSHLDDDVVVPPSAKPPLSSNDPVKPEWSLAPEELWANLRQRANDVMTSLGGGVGAPAYDYDAMWSLKVAYTQVRDYDGPETIGQMTAWLNKHFTADMVRYLTGVGSFRIQPGFTP
jgi:hypothetical protein